MTTHLRLDWSVVPSRIDDAVAELLGSRVATATNQAGGYSPGPAARCVLDDGRVVFIKACGTAINPIAVDFHRREAEVLAALPHDFPAPELVGVVDDGDWVVLITEWIDGYTPSEPLSEADVNRFLLLAERLAAAGERRHPTGVRPVHAALHFLWDNWSRLRITTTADDLEPWVVANLDELVELEQCAPTALAGDDLLHIDLRSDNVVFSSAGPHHDVAVDWPHAAIGAAWFPLLAALPSLNLSGAPDPWVLWDRQSLAATAGTDDVDAALAVLAGYFVFQARLPPPPGIPTLRDFQSRQSAITLDWLRRRT